MRRWALGERDTKAALAAVRSAESALMWHALELTERAPLCGEPFGGGPYRWDNTGRRVLDGGYKASIGNVGDRAFVGWAV